MVDQASLEKQLSLLEAHIAAADQIATGLRKMLGDSSPGNLTGQGLSQNEQTRIRAAYRAKVFKKTKLRK